MSSSKIIVSWAIVRLALPVVLALVVMSGVPARVMAQEESSGNSAAAVKVSPAASPVVPKITV